MMGLNASPVTTIPPGEYILDSPLVISTNHHVVFAHGVTLKPAVKFNGTALLRIAGTDENRVSHVNIHGLTINCLNMPIVGIDAQYTFRNTIRDCVVYGSKKQGVVIANAFDFFILNSDVRRCGNFSQNIPAVNLYGNPEVTGTWGSNTVTLDLCTIERYEYCGLLAENQRVLRIAGCKFHGLSKPATESRKSIHLKSCDGVRVTDCHSVLAKDSDIVAESCSDFVHSGTILEKGRPLKIDRR